jgi:MarR family transcriptional regulator, 2-MHQ and catechol-resistance regulon repressor
MKRLSLSPAAAAASHDPAHDGALALWVTLARSYAAVLRHVSADIGQHALTVTEFGILEALHHKGPLLLGEIQKKVLVSSGGITYVVDRLVEKGLVRRQASSTDRRARYAVLTTAGTRLISRIFPAHAAAIAEVLSGLTSREQEQAAVLLRRLGTVAVRSGHHRGTRPDD